MSNCPHEGARISGLPPYGEDRCVVCGHRVARWLMHGTVIALVPPQESRTRPKRTWPLELAGRYLAKREGRRR